LILQILTLLLRVTTIIQRPRNILLLKRMKASLPRIARIVNISRKRHALLLLVLTFPLALPPSSAKVTARSLARAGLVQIRAPGGGICRDAVTRPLSIAAIGNVANVSPVRSHVHTRIETLARSAHILDGRRVAVSLRGAMAGIRPDARVVNCADVAPRGEFVTAVGPVAGIGHVPDHAGVARGVAAADVSVAGVGDGVMHVAPSAGEFAPAAVLDAVEFGVEAGVGSVAAALRDDVDGGAHAGVVADAAGSVSADLSREGGAGVGGVAALAGAGGLAGGGAGDASVDGEATVAFDEASGACWRLEIATGQDSNIRFDCRYGRILGHITLLDAAEGRMPFVYLMSFSGLIVSISILQFLCGDVSSHMLKLRACNSASSEYGQRV